MGRGVRKVNESIMQDGRTIIITEDDNRKLDWDRIPNGTLKIHPITGQLFIKIQGEGDWIPAGLTYDGNLTIAKDARVIYEVFWIVRADNGDGTFTYRNEEGEHRTKPFTQGGKQTFELEKGSYVVKRNKVQLYVNDTLHRSDTSGGMNEIDETRLSIDEKLVAGTKVTIKYYLKFNIGNPYPRFFINAEVPETADYGDFWLDISQEMSNLKWWNGLKWLTVGAKGVKEILGANVVYKGFFVTPGSGRSVNITDGSDAHSALFIEGTRFTRRAGTASVSIPANTSGSPRVDTIYAEPRDNTLIYKVATGTKNAPNGTCKLAEVSVPSGASSISSGNITIERKALSIKHLSEDIHDATHLPLSNKLIRRDNSGRARVETPVHEMDIARKKEIDILENKKVNRSGDTMTGTLNIEGAGVFPKMSAVAPTASGSNYPVGITTFNSGSLGYPEANSTVVNHKITENNLVQWVYGNGGNSRNRAHMRHWRNSAWTPFIEATDHDSLFGIAELDTSSTNTTKNKHLSNAQAKKWEDHVNHNHPHSEHLRSPTETRLFVQNSKPVSGMKAGDIWIDTSISYGPKQ